MDNKSFFENKVLLGFFATLITFFMWGSLPIYWQLMFHMKPFVIIAYRIVSSLLFVAVIITIAKGWNDVLSVLKSKKNLLLLLICGMLMGSNWSVYIISISTNRVVEASMGYYINPLINAFFGAIFFKESLNGLQKISIGLVIAGVSYMIIGYGEVPYFALSLAVTFAIYGAIHKFIKVNLLSAMFYEFFVLTIPSILYLIYCFNIGSETNFFHDTFKMQFIILLSGVFTAVPLMGFAYGVKYLQLTTVGIIQYISPTATFFLGILYFKEAFNEELFIVFIFIWLGVLFYIADALLKGYMARKVMKARKKLVANTD